MSSLTLIVALSVWLGPPPDALATAVSSAEPPVPAVATPPKRWANGSGALAVGGTLKLASLGAGITGIALGGSPGLLLAAWSMLPSAVGGGLLITGSSLRARHRAWYSEQDQLHRVRTARRVGWPLFGVGLGLLTGSSVALMLWPTGSCVDEGCGLRYQGGAVAVGSVFVLAPLLISAGASALTWSATYARERQHRIELQPSLGGLSMRF